MIIDHNDASLYLASVKQRFQNKPDKLMQFLEIMTDFSTGRISNAVVIPKVEEIMKDHPKLLLGFSVFLNKECKTMVAKGDSTVVTMYDALEYTTSVVEALRGEPVKYKEFLKILLTSDTDIEKADQLLKDHPMLRLGLSVFLAADHIAIPPPP